MCKREIKRVRETGNNIYFIFMKCICICGGYLLWNIYMVNVNNSWVKLRNIFINIIHIW